MRHCNSEELTVENYSKTRPVTYFFWLLPLCLWHVFLPAKAAGFPETGWSCWLLGQSTSAGIRAWGSFIQLSALPCAFCSLCYYNSLPDCTQPAGSAWLLLAEKACQCNQNSGSKVERNVLPSSGSQES